MTIQAYKTKAIVSGNVFEFYRYEDTVFRGYENKKDRNHSPPSVQIDYETGEILDLSKNTESRGRSNIRARNELRRLALCNFDNRSKFLTLTFRENLTDIDTANKHFKRFIRKTKNRQGQLKYIAVTEFQKRGAVHYHMMCDLKYMKADQLANIWGHGDLNIKRISHVDNVGAYMVKHLNTGDTDPRMFNKKAYQCSKNLTRPREYIGDQAEWLYQRVQDEKRKMVYSSQYENKQTNNLITYEEYNLARM